MPATPRPPVVHNYIERDKRLRWHPAIEIRHKGIVIYAITATEGYMQPAKAVRHAMREVEAIIHA